MTTSDAETDSKLIIIIIIIIFIFIIYTTALKLISDSVLNCVGGK